MCPKSPLPAAVQHFFSSRASTGWNSHSANLSPKQSCHLQNKKMFLAQLHTLYVNSRNHLPKRKILPLTILLFQLNVTTLCNNFALSSNRMVPSVISFLLMTVNFNRSSSIQATSRFSILEINDERLNSLRFTSHSEVKSTLASLRLL